VLLGLLGFTCPPVEPAEAEVAMGHKRAQLELGGQGHSGTVVRRGRRHVGASMMRGDLAESAIAWRSMNARSFPMTEAA
jgi:hypothetical protein